MNGSIILCFLELNFMALALLLLHGLRHHLGKTPFLITVGAMLCFSYFIGAAGVELNFGGTRVDVSNMILQPSFLMALLVVYALDGTIEAQRLTLGATTLSAAYFFLSLLTVKQIAWEGFTLSVASEGLIENLVSTQRYDIAGSMAAILLDIIVLPVAFQLVRNWRGNVFVSVLGTMLITQILDTILFSYISTLGLETESAWDKARTLYFARLPAVFWLSFITSIYLKMNDFSEKALAGKDPFSYLKAMFTSYTPGSLLKEHAQEWDGRYKVFFENAHDLFFLIKGDGSIVDANSTSAKSMEFKIGEVIGKNIKDFQVIDPLELPADLKFLSKLIEEKIRPWDHTWDEVRKEDQVTVDWVLRKASGEIFSLQFHISLINVGSSQLALLIGREVTDRYRLESEQERLYEQLTHSQRLESVGRLAGGVAHDFNNLLHSIQGNVDRLSGSRAHENRQEVIANLNSAVDRASGLTGQLLGFARKGQFSVSSIELADIMNVAYDLFEPTARKSCQVRKMIFPESMLIDVDSTQLEQVFLNLLINARDAVEKRDGAKVTFRAEPANVMMHGWDEGGEGKSVADFVCIRVKDNGTGIPEELQAKIFDPFFTTKAVDKGTGMGLAMAYGCIANHKGWIHLESTEGFGTEFFLFLPRSGRNVVDQTAVLEQ